MARRQGWIVTTTELLAHGFSPSAIARLAAEGWLVRLFRGVYLVGRAVPTRDERERAALKACNGQALGRRTAAVRHGLLTRWDGPVEVAVATQRRPQRGLAPYRRQLAGHEVTTKGGVPITTVAATLVDLAAVLPAPALKRAVHEAEIRRTLHTKAVERLLEERRGNRGHAALRQALARRRPVRGRLDSTLEGEFHAFLRERGYPPSEHGAGFELDGEKVRVDVLFRRQWLAVEVDGGPHRSLRNFHSDRRRDRRLAVEHGLPVLRVTDEDLAHPDELDAQLWATLVRRDPALRRA